MQDGQVIEDIILGRDCRSSSRALIIRKKKRWWRGDNTLIFLALGRKKQEDQEFKANLGYVRPCLKINQNKKKCDSLDKGLGEQVQGPEFIPWHPWKSWAWLGPFITPEGPSRWAMTDGFSFLFAYFVGWFWFLGFFCSPSCPGAPSVDWASASRVWIKDMCHHV